MKATLDKTATAEIAAKAANAEKLTMNYPHLYCPRCGSYQIGFMRYLAGEVIWECRDCSAEFMLEFPRQNRF